MSADLDALKRKLQQLESSLKKILETTEQDLNVANELQRLLQKDRLPAIPGIKCFARYISAHQISSEGFDIISTQKGREIWIISSWTETFGLSSVLLQAMVHIQSKALIDSRTDMSPAEVFNDLSTSLAAAKRAGGYRLMVAKLDNHSLKLSGYSIGTTPFLKRSLEKNKFQPLEWLQPEAFSVRPELLVAARSDAPTLADRAYPFSTSIAPGTRLFYLSSSWADDDSSLTERMACYNKRSLEKSQDVLGDLNQLLMAAEDELQAQGEESDLTGLAFEIDARKLHLA